MQQKLVQKSQREREKKKFALLSFFTTLQIKMSKKFESKCRKSSNQNVEKVRIKMSKSSNKVHIQMEHGHLNLVRLQMGHGHLVRLHRKLIQFDIGTR
jgi:hypothetical protein